MALSKTTNNRIVWAVRLLLALAFGAAGAAKLAGAPLMIQIFEHIGFGQWFRYVTGLVEVAGAVLLLIPRTGFLGGLLLAVTMVCALATHLLIIGGNPAPAALLALLSAFVAYSLRSPYGELARAGERT
ncbi:MULTISPECIES: DoxX family protein [Paraburkholderia]|uniref:DoxX family protein n=1 Tax=Paraburkholderia TaxID=1822464 RepID=UPI00224ECB88|nr:MULTISPECIES: DoxX family protein [Paraburkholderia]MCX4163001.1 DoxX family protein [Paraburkholderia megapolitana]MDN7158497.1 DoxX family protein [Paraburkholderia sp. CHISQ3]MDQ6495544.1 DoxX family protein [Paraburkholderia megapolitana]